MFFAKNEKGVCARRGRLIGETGRESGALSRFDHCVHHAGPSGATQALELSLCIISGMTGRGVPLHLQPVPEKFTFVFRCLHCIGRCFQFRPQNCNTGRIQRGPLPDPLSSGLSFFAMERPLFLRNETTIFDGVVDSYPLTPPGKVSVLNRNP